MRPLFKIRKFNGADSHLNEREIATPNHPSDSRDKTMQVCQENMNSLMSMFETFMKHTLKTNCKDTGIYDSETFNKSESQYETRDRHIILRVPSFDGDLSRDKLQKWTTQICNAAFSSAFNYFLTEQMTFQQAKVFCSQTIMGNLLRLTEQQKLKEEQMAVINNHLSGSSLEYLQLKYPLTLANDFNKALDKDVEPMNNFQDITNDFLYLNGIIFKFRQNGNYNDMIMKVLNTAMETIDETSKMNEVMPGISNFQDFEIYISSIFEKVYNEQWVYGYKTSKLKGRQEEQKNKYAEKVKEYTTYLIGRKISQNTAQFSEQEINGQNLVIKSPAILRILTKWCEELWSKFAKESYYTQRAEPVILQDPEFINPFFKWMKNSVDKRLQQQKKKIQEFKKELESHCNYQEAAIMLKYLEEDHVNFISKYEKANGKFSTHMVQNLHTYIVLYLNRLIHGLLTVSKEFYDKEIDKSWDGWQSPPNFVTFKIGDLVRCKCSSKEKEIMKIFRDINNISVANPQRMKIIRIKNRLRQGTNDILLNVRFNDKVICEIQLEVINKSKTKFIKCSNAFSHFIYELKRSIFGPISELCNIWNNFDARSKAFSKLIHKEKELNLTQTMQAPSCNETQLHDFEKYILPFECGLCGKSYFHSNYIFSNKKCKICSFKYCVNCQIRDMSNEELKNQIFRQKKDKMLKESCSKLTSDKVPIQGVCIKIQSKEIKIQIFKYMKVESKYWLLGVTNDGSLYEIERAQTNKEIARVLKNYCIFEIKSSSQFIRVTAKEAEFFAVQEYLKRCYRENKQSLILTQIRFTVQEMKTLLQVDGGSEQDHKMVKKIEFASNYVSSISYFSCFESLTDINLDFNSFQNIDELTMLKKLETIQIRDNSKLVQIGDSIEKLQKLEDFKCSKCAIKTISENLGKLKNLTFFKADKNLITALPSSICELTSLKVLTVSSNKLEVIPENIGDLTNLRTLKLGNNILKDLPKSISNLVNLTILSVSDNELTECPDLSNMAKLQKLEMNSNKIREVRATALENENLKVVNFSQNILSKFNVDMTKCKHLEHLFLNKNKLTEISDTLVICSNLQTLELLDNQFDHIPDFITKLKKLPTAFNFSKNKLKEVPEIVKQMIELTSLNFQENQIQELPLWLPQLGELKQINFSKNKIKCIPESFSSLKGLDKLDFKYNEIQQIPDFMAQFKYIQQSSSYIDLIFRNNKIGKLSGEIIKAMKPQIRLTHNNLVEIPLQDIDDKTLVTSIRLSNNVIKNIPPQIQQFVNLTSLDLSLNQIEVVPAELEMLSKISYNGLALNSNPLITVHCKDFVIKKGTYATKSFVKKLNTEEEKHTQSAVYQDSSDD